ncbi:uncharacterized acetyltransferase At3g50280-like [Hibiscus syriacus]|uniref:uncharacterized acetyltransferase At3g50280-like n=1 Tax=Hibiscus syriacus TaxID=106335 RepID=UPI0019214A49|nr:uncharacterized acetyltransferase At3g50280-like [Hibiscus syriacus]
MAAVRSISTSTVHVADSKESCGRIELNPWDLRLLQIGYIQKGFVFGTPVQDRDTLIHHLRTSLSDALVHFPLLAGRLATTRHEDDDTVSFFIDCNDAGAVFVHATADGVTVSDVVETGYVPSVVHSCFALNGIRNYEGVDNPLLGIQVTDLVDGIFLGCSMNHVVADGTSFWHFLNSWSEISRGSINLSKPPVFRRWFPDGMDTPIRIPRTCLDVERCNEDVVQPSTRERIFHFSKKTVAKLKAKANADIGTDKVSSLQALLSHVWRSVIRNRSLDPNEETKYRIVVGARQRFPELPDNYFGNAILGTSLTMKPKELTEQGIGNPAWRMNRTIATMTGESLKNSLEYWPASPNMATMSHGEALLTSSSPRFDMYGNDFGWGKPMAIRGGSSNKVDGMLTLFCGAEEGSIDVEMCLFPETLEAIASDEEFMDTVTN